MAFADGGAATTGGPGCPGTAAARQLTGQTEIAQSAPLGEYGATGCCPLAGGPTPAWAAEAECREVTFSGQMSAAHAICHDPHEHLLQKSAHKVDPAC